MQLALYNDYRLGVIRGDRVVDSMEALEGVAFHSPQEMMQMVIRGWSELGPKIEGVSGGKEGMALNDVRLRAPLPRPGQMVCLAGNYMEPAYPERGEFNAFLKSTSAVIGHGDTVELPEAEAKVFHFEPELGVVIGKPASHLSQSNALEHVFGYTMFIDASARGLPGGFFLGKSWHTFAPMGPALVTSDEVADPNKLALRMWVNGELRHDFSTGEMARFIPEVLEEVTKVLALEPGDVVSTGTHHFSLGPIGDGDTLRMEIEGLGPELAIKVHDPLKRSWDQGTGV